MLVSTTWLLLLLPGLASSWCQDRGTKCFDDEFKCKSGICIDATYRCDGEDDCGDYSDEENCKEEYRIRCGENRFMCDGECKPTSLQCNGYGDCNDLLDEAFCDKTSTTTQETTTEDIASLSTSSTCSENEFKCKTGTCIDNAYRCDGEKDCEDHSDEAECQEDYSIKCRGSDFFMCDGECRPIRLQCDGTADCYDGLDEAFCSNQVSTPIPDEMTKDSSIAPALPLDTEYIIPAMSSKDETGQDGASDPYENGEIENGIFSDRDVVPNEAVESESWLEEDLSRLDTTEQFQFQATAPDTTPHEVGLLRNAAMKVGSNHPRDDRLDGDKNTKKDNQDLQTKPNTEERPEDLVKQKEWNLYTPAMPGGEVDTLFALLRHTPQSAMQSSGSTLPRSLLKRAEEILRADPEALAAILDELGEDVPEKQKKQEDIAMAQRSYMPLDNDGDWVTLDTAHDLTHTQNETLLHSALDIIYSLWEVMQTPNAPANGYKLPAETDEGKRDVVAALFKLFDEDAKNMTMKKAESSTTPGVVFDDSRLYRVTENRPESEFVRAPEALIWEEDDTKNFGEVSQPSSREDSTTRQQEGEVRESSTVVYQQAEGKSITISNRGLALLPKAPLSSTTETVQPSPPLSDCLGDEGADCEDKDESETASSEDIEKNNEIDEGKIEDDLLQEDNNVSTTEEAEVSSTSSPKSCSGPGPTLSIADSHFCFKAKPYYPVGTYIRLYSEVESFHIYLVALQLTGGDMAALRLNPWLFHHIGVAKIAESIKVSSEMSIPLLLEIDVIDVVKMKDKLFALSNVIRKQSDLILGWNFQVNNKTIWITNKYGVLKNICINETLSIEYIKKFREEMSRFGHSFSLTVTLDEPDFPTNPAAKKVIRKKCDYSRERWISLSAEISDFNIIDSKKGLALSTPNKDLPLLFKGADVQAGENQDKNYGGFIVDAGSTVASLLKLRQFRNLVPAF